MRLSSNYPCDFPCPACLPLVVLAELAGRILDPPPSGPRKESTNQKQPTPPRLVSSRTTASVQPTWCYQTHRLPRVLCRNTTPKRGAGAFLPISAARCVAWRLIQTMVLRTPRKNGRDVVLIFSRGWINAISRQVDERGVRRDEPSGAAPLRPNRIPRLRRKTTPFRLGSPFKRIFAEEYSQ